MRKILGMPSNISFKSILYHGLNYQDNILPICMYVGPVKSLKQLHSQNLKLCTDKIMLLYSPNLKLFTDKIMLLYSPNLKLFTDKIMLLYSQKVQTKLCYCTVKIKSFVQTNVCYYSQNLKHFSVKIQKILNQNSILCTDKIMLLCSQN